MPLSRYQIRNEYSLADPELYRAADKDDPEALLEGVAMAGLVGVLRQLGDLAEFAAEIFHDLHEEVMATAARGHGLMVRVQQLEVEFPSIEKAFLSQTNHSQFIANPGVEWHPNLHTDQNLITQGDLPRFIMDSYEECRGPPRLFLLDKFDVAGAGACLKRYTDPSFYKVETSSDGRTNTEVQRERKARKTKKKGPRWRNGETPEVLPTSHVKLQQLLLEDRIENGISDPARLVKLKRRSNGFPFDSKAGKSYMEKIINTPLEEDKLVHEISIDYPALKLPSNITSESVQTNSSPGSSPNMEKAVLKSSKDDFTNEKEIEVDLERKGDDNQYDDIASEIDNYVDALPTMESDIEMDTETKAKSDAGFFTIEKQEADSDANEEHLQAQFSDSQSIGNSAASDDGNSSSKRDVSSFSYTDTASTSAENTPEDRDDGSPNVSPSNVHFEDGVTNIPSNQIFSNGEITVDEGAISVQRSLEERNSDDQLDSGLVNAEENLTDNLPFTSKLSDVPLQTTDDFQNPVSSTDQSVDKVDEEDSSVFSSEVEVAPEIESREVLQESLVQTECAEDGATTNSVISVAEELPFVPALSEFETCHSDVTTDGIVSADDAGPSGGKIEVKSSEAEDTPDATEQLVSEIADNVYPLEFESADIKETETVESGNPVEAIAVSISDIDDAKEDESNSQSSNFTDLQEESISSIKESDEACIGQNHEEPGIVEKDYQQPASPVWNSATDVLDDHSDSEVLKEHIIDSPQIAEADNSLHPSDVIAVPLYSENNNQDSDSKSPQLNNVIEDAEDTLSSPTHSFAEQNVNLHHLEPLHAVEESPDLQLGMTESRKHIDQETPVDTTYAEHDEVDFESVSPLGQLQPPLNQTDKEICVDTSPESSPADRPCEASESRKLEISEQLAEEDSLPIASPVFSLVPAVSDINLEEMPPLPPLPPMQWRMGKPSFASHVAMEQRNVNHFPQMFPSNPFVPHSAVEYENSQNVMTGTTVHSSPISFSLPTMSSVNPENYAQPMNPFLEVRETYEERPQHSSLAEEGTTQPQINPLSTLGTIAHTSSTHAFGSPHEQLVQPLNQLPQEENAEDKKIEVNPPTSVMESSPIVENDQPQYAPSHTEGGFMWSSSAAPFAPAVEDGKPKPLKLMRPRSPLIDAVAAHDKSKLRKVTERVQPQIQKVDERDSLLEQIRTKSFNLKPAVATRPSIQGPKTNLRVAAILEKANAIRQALAGSDEDDDADSWSSD